MHILCVIPFYKPAYVYGGPTRSIPTLCENLVTLGCDVTVYTTNANGSTVLPVTPNQANMVDGVEVYYFQRSVRGTYFYSANLGQACHRHAREFDLIYVASNWGYPFVPACRSAQAARTPYVITPRASFKRNTWEGRFAKKLCYHWLVERRLINRAAAVHYTTALERNDSLWLKLRPPDFIIPNPVDLAEFEQLPPRGLFRAKYGIPSDREVILYLGRVEPAKGLDIALESFAKVAMTNPKANLVIAGPEEDNYRRVLDRMIVALNIVKRVLLTGLLDARTRLEALFDTDVFILTSYSENLGMSAVEAMAAGVPVLVSDRVGLADDIQHEQMGVVVPLDVEAIARHLRELLNSPDQRQLMGRRAAQIVREKYAPRPVAEAMRDKFQQIIDHA